MDESIEKHAIVYLPPGADQSMLSALHADGWKDVGRSDQLESAFSFLLVCREDLLKHPPSQPTNLEITPGIDFDSFFWYSLAVKKLQSHVS